MRFQCTQMVQQTIDSKFSGYGIPNTETGLANQDKQLPLPVTAKKMALRDLQNENRIAVPKSLGSSLFPKESGPTIKAVKASGTKRPAPECLVSAPQHQSPTSNAANGHLVYVRRRPEVELAKSSIFDNTNSNAYCPQARKLGDQDETPQPKSQMKEPKTCVPEVAPIPRTSLMCYSSGKPSVPLSIGKSSNIVQPTDANYLPISSSTPPLDYPKKMNNQHWEERYCQLQDLLKILDQSNQEDYVQMLRSLSSVELSRHAVELEKRSIQLSLEEGRQKRYNVFDFWMSWENIQRSLERPQHNKGSQRTERM
ncbi:unnamed protein product [Camellia sinensis]